MQMLNPWRDTHIPSSFARSYQRISSSIRFLEYELFSMLNRQIEPRRSGWLRPRPRARRPSARLPRSSGGFERLLRPLAALSAVGTDVPVRGGPDVPAALALCTALLLALHRNELLLHGLDLCARRLVEVRLQLVLHALRAASPRSRASRAAPAARAARCAWRRCIHL